MCANLQFKEGILEILRQSRRSFILQIIGATGLEHVFLDCTAKRKDQCLITKHLVPAGDGFVAPCFLGYTGASDPAEYKMATLVLLLGAVLANDSIIVVYCKCLVRSHSQQRRPGPWWLTSFLCRDSRICLSRWHLSQRFPPTIPSDDSLRNTIQHWMCSQARNNTNHDYWTWSESPRSFRGSTRENFERPA